MPKTVTKRRDAPAEITSLDSLISDDRNANRGTDKGNALLEKSLEDYGAGRSVLADRKGRLIAGNKTVEAARKAGLPVEVVRSDGRKVIVVQRTDLDLKRDRKARELAIVDNKAGELNLDWDTEVLAGLSEDYNIDLTELGFKEPELPGEDDTSFAPVAEQWIVIVTCKDEADQLATLDRLTKEGMEVRAVSA